MPDKMLLPDTVTVYNALGGNDSGAGYQRTVLHNVRIERREEKKTRNCASGSEMKVYMFFSCISSGRTFADSGRWNEAPDKSLYYTVRAGRDYMAPGECSEADPLKIPECMRISAAEHYACGRLEYTVVKCN